jgi:hypothetical protein
VEIRREREIKMRKIMRKKCKRKRKGTLQETI